MNEHGKAEVGGLARDYEHLLVSDKVRRLIGEPPLNQIVTISITTTDQLLLLIIIWLSVKLLGLSMDFRGRGMGSGIEKEGPALHLLFIPCERQFFIDFFSISRWTHGVGVITQHFEVASSGERRTSLGSHAEIAGSIPAGSYIALFAPLYALCISALNVYIYSSHIGAHLPLQVGKSLPKSSSGPSRVRVRVWYVVIRSCAVCEGTNRPDCRSPRQGPGHPKERRAGLERLPRAESLPR